MRTLDTFSVDASYAESEKEIPQKRRVVTNSTKMGYTACISIPRLGVGLVWKEAYAFLFNFDRFS